MEQRKESLQKETDDLALRKRTAQSQLGHFSTKNVNKRESRLRERVAVLVKTKEELLNNCTTSDQLFVGKNEELLNARDKISLLEEQRTTARRDIQELKKTQILEKEIEFLSVRKQKAHGRKEKGRSCRKKKVKRLHQINKELNLTATENERLKDSYSDRQFVPKVDGIFIPELRECILELIIHKVSAENVAPVIKSVLDMVGVFVNEEDLPSRQVAVNIVAEGHFLMKLFYADAIEHSSAWGLHKDGTSRQKKKILTSTVTLNTGQQLPLGFRHVARETSDTISSTFRKDLEETEQVRNMDENHKRDKGFLQEALEKLT